MRKADLRTITLRRTLSGAILLPLLLLLLLLLLLIQKSFSLVTLHYWAGPSVILVGQGAHQSSHYYLPGSLHWGVNSVSEWFARQSLAEFPGSVEVREIKDVHSEQRVPD